MLLHTRCRSIQTTTASLFAAALLFAVPHLAFAQCGELVVNGDFEEGNTGFTSQYLFTPAPTGTPPTQTLDAGRYDILPDPNRTHHCFGGVDHTSGSGNAMYVNAATAGNTVVWSQTVNVLTGTNYALSAWVNSQCDGISHATLEFRVNGTPVGLPFFAPVSDPLDWIEFTATWASGSSTTATIEIVDLNLSGSGNDFGLDDISFKKIDETAPAVSVVTGLELSPPNHEYHTFTLSQLVTSVSDDCDTSPQVYISAAGSDEVEDAIDLGDGETLEDIVIAPDCQSIQLRAERQGNSNGRVYTVYVSAMDASGNTSTVECHIAVRHNVRRAAVNDGVASGYAVSGGCGGSAKAIGVSAAPMRVTLDQNFPNPFNPSTEIRFTLTERTEVRLSVLDHLGREVSVLENGMRDAGAHTVHFNAVDLPSGLYFYRLDAAGQATTKKMMLMK